MSPGDFDRASLKPSAPASNRLAFPNASSVSRLPFTSVAFAMDTMTYTATPELLKTVAAVATPLANATTTMTISSPTLPSLPIHTGTGSGIFPGMGLALSVALAIAVFLS